MSIIIQYLEIKLSILELDYRIIYEISCVLKFFNSLKICPEVKIQIKNICCSMFIKILTGYVTKFLCLIEIFGRDNL